MGEKYRVINGFDYKNEPCKLIECIETEERYSTENDLEANSLCNLVNEQDKEIKRLKCINRQLEERLDKSVALDMSRCGKYVFGVHGGSND